MATSVGEIGLDLVVNQQQFNRQMQGITSLAKKAGLALAAAFSVKKIADFGKECIELGSDLAEVQNVVDVTFPNMTAKVDEFAKSAANSFGLSETMAKQFTGTFGSMAKAFGFSESEAYDMSTALTGLAGDVASFYNISQDEAYTKLKSVFSGETETLKDLGVVMNQNALDAYAMANGFGKTTSEMTEAEKVMLRFQFVSEQLSAAQGDFARTSGSWANQTRILKLQFDSLKASLGQGFINLFTPILKGINTLLGKLATLANAFKSFTELITGNKSGSTSQVSSMGDAATAASTGMDDASASADNMADSTKAVGNAAKKAAKEMRSLMGFDKIQRLDSNDTSSDSSSSTPSSSGSSGTGGLGSAVDFGNLASGETVVDKVDSKFQGLIERCKELAALFKKGFRIGFGDSQKKINSMNKSIRSIGKNLKGIFTDKSVVDAVNSLADSVAVALGKMAGSCTRIGLTIADNLLGGFSKYLERQKEYIKKRLVSIFDISKDIADLGGDFAVALADIFDVFSGDTAKGITADIIGIFSDGFMGALNAGLVFVRALQEMICTPVINNVEGIKNAIENTLAPIQTALDTIYQGMLDTFQKIADMYNEHVKPFVDSLTEGFSSILNKFLDGYNTYLAPVLDAFAQKFSTVWQTAIQPMLNSAIDLLGKVFDLLKVIWENVLQPFLEWFAANMLPVISPVIQAIGEGALGLLTVISQVIAGAISVLDKILDFLISVFSADWGKAWENLSEIVDTFKSAIDKIFRSIQDNILTPAANFYKGTFAPAWKMATASLGKAFTTFKNGVVTAWNSIKEKFNGILDFVKGTFADKWKTAWESIKETFGNIFSGLVNLLKSPLNAVISKLNSFINSINNTLAKIESAFSFSYDFTNPITGTRHSGHYGLSLPSIPNIPALAQGGWVEKNTPQLAMIGDNRHQGEVVAPEDKLREIAAEAVKAAGSSGISRDEFERIVNSAVMRIISALSDMGFYLDSRQLAKANRAAQDVIDMRYNAVSVG